MMISLPERASKGIELPWDMAMGGRSTRHLWRGGWGSAWPTARV